MPNNIEIKAQIASTNELIEKIKTMGAKGPWVLNQYDTYYKFPLGRLKIRTVNDEISELIIYYRSNNKGPKISRYSIFSLGNYCGLVSSILNLVFKETARVNKKRILFLHGNTRIHVDSVEKLGSFYELEVVLKDNESIKYGQEIANNIMEKLGTKNSQLIQESYSDMIMSKMHSNNCMQLTAESVTSFAVRKSRATSSGS
jgi:predicted adenylyl cyclase CyaB